MKRSQSSDKSSAQEWLQFQTPKACVGLQAFGSDGVLPLGRCLQDNTETTEPMEGKEETGKD